MIETNKNNSKSPKYPHKMYKGLKVKTVKNKEEHNKLMKLGYNHIKPTKQNKLKKKY